MYSTVETMNDCEYSVEITIEPLKERIDRTNFCGNKYTTDERITQTMEECKFSCKKKSGTIQIMNDCNYFCGKYTTSTDTQSQVMNGLPQLECWNK